MEALGVLGILAIPVGIIGFICGIIIVIHAFQNQIWKGLLSLFCGIYTIVYAITEFDHDKRPLILTGYLASAGLGIVLQILSISMGAGGLGSLGK
jgi:benzodiazapine receptor